MSVELIGTFYKAFQKRDAEGMVACYADDVHFRDPAFGDLHGERAKGMWRMLCSRAADLEIAFRDVCSDGATGRAHWDARYTFTQTGRKVLNIIDAAFRLRDGKIVEHIDTFSFWRWSRQALGPAGLLLGWTPILRFAVRKKALQGLDQFLAKRS
jgi:ketosteroid isomerase-like protein